MKYPKLRIAWSVAWGVVALSLCVLWVRSYWRSDNVWHFGPDRHYLVSSVLGGLLLTTAPATNAPGATWYYENRETYTGSPIQAAQYSMFRFQYKDETLTGFKLLFIPSWFTTLLAMLVGVAPWITRFPYRFSLRTLLILTTLVAVLLGLIVWLW